MELNPELLRRYLDKAFKAKSEYNKIEFKDARGGFSKQVWKAISAFSNTTGGGYIIYGVAEDRASKTLKTVKLDNLGEIQERLTDFVGNEMINSGNIKIHLFDYDGNQLLGVIIEECETSKKPCYYKPLGMPTGACIRVGNVNKVISDEELRAFLRYSPEYKYDIEIIKNLNKDDLSKNKTVEYLKQSAERTSRVFKDDTTNDKSLINIGILRKDEDVLKPTIAGYLIFAKENPQVLNLFSRILIRCVRYSGISVSSKIIDKQDVSGTLDQQIESVQKFILRNIKTNVSIVGTKRIERYEYPEDALREIVANSIIHRDYQITATYTQISIFSDRIEISNPGTLPPGVTVDNLKEAQFSRNQIIASIMRDMKYMEEFGRGIDLVYSQMLEWGLVEPLFKNKVNTFKVTLLGERYKALNQRQIRIWYFLQDKDKITASEANDLFPDISRATINNDLKKMVEHCLIKSIGSSSNTYYVASY
ncbi:MAG: ATP-binding protein [bacterium]|nr:ATP-binding protein [bacterium]